MPLHALREFLKLESASGILLVMAGACAMVIANSPLLDLYQALLQTPIKVQVGNVLFDKTLVIWINDLLMAIFFLLVGLEIKREVVAGELSERAKVALPAIAALGGMTVTA
jgi:NhaA family Na+:H+ antiporter